MKAKYYECKYRENAIGGNHHSSCHHPLVKKSFIKAALLLKIEGNKHGIKNGWFLWPFNFDSIWLENCEGFKVKEQIKKEELKCQGK